MIAAFTSPRQQEVAGQGPLRQAMQWLRQHHPVQPALQLSCFVREVLRETPAIPSRRELFGPESLALISSFLKGTPFPPVFKANTATVTLPKPRSFLQGVFE